MDESAEFFDGSPSEVAARKPRVKLALSQRIDVIEQYENGRTVPNLSIKYNCSQSQIKNIVRNRSHYRALWSERQLRTTGPSYKIYNKFEALGSNTIGMVLHEWVTRARAYHINITDDILRSFGQEISDHMQFKDFKPTNNWLIRFKQMYKLLDLDTNIKQEKDMLPEDRKPLSISVIIDDLRRTYGELVVPRPELNGIRHANRNPGSVERYASGTNENAGGQSDNGNDSDKKANLPEPNRKHFDSSMKVAREITSFREALNQLGPLEQFALLNENIRAVGLINQLENLFRDEMEKDELKRDSRFSTKL